TLGQCHDGPVINFITSGERAAQHQARGELAALRPYVLMRLRRQPEILPNLSAMPSTKRGPDWRGVRKMEKCPHRIAQSSCNLDPIRLVLLLKLLEEAGGMIRLEFLRNCCARVGRAFLLLVCMFAPVAAQNAELRRVPRRDLPTRIDGNSPAFWRDGKLTLFSS